MTFIPFDVFYEKTRQGLDIRSQSELAAILGVHRSAVTQAKRKNTVPDAWLVKLGRHFDVDPGWLASTGSGPPVLREAVTAVPRVRARLHTRVSVSSNYMFK